MAQKPGPENTVPLAEDSVEIGKRTVERDRTLIRKTVAYRDEDVEIPLSQEELSIERIPVGRVVSAMPLPREENGALIVPVVEERLVITKQIFLVEELRVCRVRKQQIARQTVRLRREEVHIEHPTNHHSKENNNSCYTTEHYKPCPGTSAHRCIRNIRARTRRP